MKELSAVSPGSAYVLEPDTEGSLDELPVTLVPAQEDELPQGVLDLIATLVVRHRSETLVSVGEGLDRRGLVTHLPEQVESSHRRSHKETHSNVGVSLIAKATAQALINPLGSSRVSTEAPSTTPEPLPVERAANISSTPEPLSIERPANISTPTTLAADAPPPEALMNLHSLRHALSVAPVSIPLPPAPVPKPALDMKIETLPDSNRSMLQIPFNNGAASGQVTITRVPDESTHNLLLSPSNALVLEQLKAPFELVRDPGWRLTDNGDEQQHQGSHPSPDEEQDEHQELPA